MTEPILTRWLGGESLADLGADEQALRVELAAVQKVYQDMDHRGEVATNQRNAMKESAKKLNLLIGVYSEQAKAVGVRFGEWPDVDSSPLECGCLPSRHHFYRGFLCGQGHQATRQQRHLDALGNLVRARATADAKVGT